MTMKKTNICGIGNDIIEVERIRESIERYANHFLDRLFTKREQSYCDTHQDPTLRYAGRFAAKEAIVKSMGTGFGKEIGWHDIEIINEESGKPEVIFSDKIKTQFNHPQVLVSISHCKTYATAVAIRIS